MGHRWPSRACYDSTSHISMVQESWEAVGKKDVLYDLPVSNHGARCEDDCLCEKFRLKNRHPEPRKAWRTKKSCLYQCFLKWKDARHAYS